MRVIPGTFFITGLGRSGTRFLATILGRSRRYRVIHEWQLGPLYRERDIRGFPLWRFYLGRLSRFPRRGGYGEVNSYLRHVISPGRVGIERWIYRRAIVFRDPRDVLASAMNRPSQVGEMFGDVAYRIFADYAKLHAISQSPEIEYEVFEFERMVSDLEYLRGVVRWTGVKDVEVSREDMERKVNTNPAARFPRWQQWSTEQKELVVGMESRLVPVGVPRLSWESS